jgi:hypothetical protein
MTGMNTVHAQARDRISRSTAHQLPHVGVSFRPQTTDS